MKAWVNGLPAPTPTPAAFKDIDALILAKNATRKIPKKVQAKSVHQPSHIFTAVSEQAPIVALRSDPHPIMVKAVEENNKHVHGDFTIYKVSLNPVVPPGIIKRVFAIGGIHL